MFMRSAEEFVDWFNEKYPGAYRRITAEDVRDMTICGLIGRYRYYSESADGETVRGILQYEQMRQKRLKTSQAQVVGSIHCCKICS